MDAGQALADLTEISAQIESAVLAGHDGSVVASTVEDESKSKAIAEGAVELLTAAEQARGDTGSEPLVQLEAATREGSVFVVKNDQHLVAAVTRARPTVGLVFYDLKTCLRLVEQEEEEEAKASKGTKTATRKRTTKKKQEEATGEGS
jgi:predicted regulator of Ras-like GTPase activity (Roadblock/LC7/MglB family)